MFSKLRYFRNDCKQCKYYFLSTGAVSYFFKKKVESGAIRRKGLSQDFRCNFYTLDANPAWHIAAPPCKIFGECNLRNAIDFAEAAYPRKAWPALH